MSLRATIKAVSRRKRGTMFPLAPTVQGSAKDRDEAMWNGAVRTLATKETPWGVTEGKHPADALSIKAKDVSAAATDRAGYLAAAKAHDAAAVAHDDAGHIQKKVHHRRVAAEIRKSADRQWPITERTEISGEDEAARMSALRSAGRHGAPLAQDDHDYFAKRGPYTRIDADPHKINAQYDAGSEPDDRQQAAIDDYARRTTPMPAITGSVAPNGTIIATDGNHRVMAARKRGDKTIAVHIPTSHLPHLGESAMTAFGDEPAPGVPTLDTQLAPTGAGSVRPTGPALALAIQQRMWQKKQQQGAGIRADAMNSAALVRDNQPPETSTANPGAALQMPADLR